MHAKHSDSIRFRSAQLTLLPCGFPLRRKRCPRDPSMGNASFNLPLSLLLKSVRFVSPSLSFRVCVCICEGKYIYLTSGQYVLDFLDSAIPSSRITEAEYRPGTSGNRGE